MTPRSTGRTKAARSWSALLLLVILAPAAGAAEWRTVEPAGYESRVNVSVDEKQLTYYRFGANEPLRFSVEGPARVKILTRLRVHMSEASATCAIEVLRDGVSTGVDTLAAPASERSFYIGFEDFRPSVIRRLYIDVPTGTHGYEIRPVGRARVDARVFRAAESKPSRVSLAPDEYAGVETFYYRDKELVYYLAEKSRNVVLNVIGPTTVKVNSRLIFGRTMLSGQTYVLGVKGPGPEEMLYKIETEPSETVVFRDRDDVVPGALRHFMLEVPEGEQRYEFRVADSLGAGVALKFYIPNGDLSNEP
ncbi:MAG: hypothetical protein ABIG03_03915 [Candidatus Eisenbacteria bacterium]